MKEKEVTFPSDGETLSGYFVLAEKSGPKLLFLHGAGQATKERALPLARHLAEQIGASSFLFDFSGHGSSTGALKESSLERRLIQARDALAYSEFKELSGIVAFSMGAHVAIHLADEVKPKALVFFYPAIYTKEVFKLPFGEEKFTETIRKSESWNESDASSRLRRFTGNVLVVAGTEDEVIPQEVFEKILTESEAAQKKKMIWVEGGSHLVLPGIFEHPKIFSKVCVQIAEFIK